MRLPSWPCLVFALVIWMPVFGAQKVPECSGRDAWPPSMAFTHLKNAHAFGDGDLDDSKTEVTLLASEPLGKELFRQFHLVRFSKKSGDAIEALTLNNSSGTECSESDVAVYVVTQELGNQAVAQRSNILKHKAR